MTAMLAVLYVSAIILVAAYSYSRRSGGSNQIVALPSPSNAPSSPQAEP
jgi:hypothetical protein